MYKVQDLGDGISVTFAPLDEAAKEASALNAKLPLERPFACLIASDKPRADDSAISSLIDWLLDIGCKLFVCVGTCSEELHDLIDVVAERRTWGSAGSAAEGSSVLSTWHPSDCLEEAVDTFFCLSKGDRISSLLVLLDNRFVGAQRLRKAIFSAAPNGSDQADRPGNRRRTKH